MPNEAIYVNVGPMSVSAKSVSHVDARLRKQLSGLMHDTAKKVLGKVNGVTTQSSNGKTPSSGFYVDGSLVTLTTQLTGARTTVGCKVSLLIATFPKKSIFATLDGNAKVIAGSRPKDIEYATQDCVAAVVENLVKNRAVKAIQVRAQQGRQ
jgi:hypothetical protein